MRSTRRNVSEAFCQPSEFLSAMGEERCAHLLGVRETQLKRTGDCDIILVFSVGALCLVRLSADKALRNWPRTT